jgi:glutaconyl-CoA/methylmalonyl-CoA decarboxylase subunit gamma
MKQYKVTVNGLSYDVSVEDVKADTAPDARAVASPTTAQPAATPKSVVSPSAPSPSASPVGSAGLLCIKSPMPGTVISFKVLVGQEVKRGDVLLILEAMKMENEIVAPQAGKVAALRVPVGAAVNTSDPLVDLE